MLHLSRVFGARAHSGLQWRRDGRVETMARDLAEETAIGIAFDSRPYVVLMGSPGDVEDLAVGFTVTERIAARADIVKVAVTETAHGFLADILLTPEASTAAASARRRTLEARSSCGLCGVESLSAAVRPPVAVGEGPRVTRSAIHRALAALAEDQKLGVLTRATHAAAWIEVDSEARLVREDVGRHNALDKVVGAALLSGRDPTTAMMVITSRCSYEMVDKTAAAGVSILVAISAPTALAVRQAETAGLTLVALARADGHVVFTRADRIEGA